MDSYASRRQRVSAMLEADDVDALLVSHPVNVSYLTGFSGESSMLILTAARALLVSDGRFTAQLAEECPGLETCIRPPVQPLLEAAGATLNKLGVSAVGIEAGHLTLMEFEALRGAAATVDWKHTRDRVEKLRAIKDSDEIQQIREAIRIAERAFAMFVALLRPDDSEKELADALEGYIRRAGGKCGSFSSIVAVGDRAALPHAPPTGKRVRDAKLVLVDWGASGTFYKSDLTRVLLTHNTNPFQALPAVAAKLREVYAVVLQAQERAIAAVRPGVKAREVDAAARAYIAQAGYGDYFSHGLGHGLGMQVHEAPFLKPGSEVVLEAGMVITIEPGIYLPGELGVRIEDDVLVTPDGCEIMTHVPKDMESSIIDIF